MNKKICITGAAGYIGSRLVQEWIKNKYELICIDRFSNGINQFKEITNDSTEIIKTDIRNVENGIFKNIDIVVDLSAKSKNTENENTDETVSINQYGRQLLARRAKEEKVKKYIRISGSSVYGLQREIVDEKTHGNPSTSYAKANLMADNALIEMNNKKFAVTILRFPSVFGFSPNMRWDEAVNSMVLSAHKNKKITVYGRSHKRSFLHILDAIRSIEYVLNANNEVTSGEIFNVGDKKLNYKIEDLAKEIANFFEYQVQIELKDSPDLQSHVMSFKKIYSKLGFRTKFDINFGINEIYQELIKQKN